MKESSSLIPIPSNSLRIYAAAARILKRELGREAPTAVVLIAYELSHRRARMIADDYLEAYGHEVHAPKLRDRVPAVARRRRVFRSEFPADLSRN